MLLNQVLPLNTEEESRSDWLALISRGSLYFLIGGLLAFGKDFAYLGIDTPFTTIYISEIFIAFNILAIAADLLRGRFDPKLKSFAWFLPLIIYGGVLAALGFSEHGILAIRQYAMIYYCIMAILVYMRFHLKDINILLSFMLICSLAHVVLRIFDLLYDDFILPNIGPLAISANAVALIILYYLIYNMKTSKKWSLSLLLFIPYLHLSLYPKSSLFIAYVSIALIFLVCSVIRRHRAPIAWGKLGLVIIITILAIAVSYYSVTLTLDKGHINAQLFSEMSTIFNPKFGEEVESLKADETAVIDVEATRMESAIVQQRNNSHWRIVVWTKALEEFYRQPLLGKGFGSYFTAPRLKYLKYDYSKNIDPHNSYLHLLMRTGLIGFVLFLLPHFLLLSRVLTVLRHGSASQWQTVKPWLLILTGLSAIALFNVVLENPYGAISYWFTIGTILIVCDSNPDNNKKPGNILTEHKSDSC